MTHFLHHFINFLFAIIFALLFSTEATLHASSRSHAKVKIDKNNDNPIQQPSSLNNIDKLSKKGLGVEDGDPYTTSTPISLAYHHGWYSVAVGKNYTYHGVEQTGSNSHNDVTTEEKMRRIIEMTVLICGITVVLVVFFLSVRISAHLFKKFKIYSNQRLATSTGSGDGNEMSVHYSNGRSANNAGSSSGVESSTIRPSAPAAASLYAVMPGHFLLQPCYPGSSSDTPSGSGPSSSSSGGGGGRPTSTTTTTISTSRHVDGTYRPGIRGMSSITTQIEDDAQIHHHIAVTQSYPSTSHPSPPRAETPPPPYPGSIKDEVKGQSDQKNEQST